MDAGSNPQLSNFPSNTRFCNSDFSCTTLDFRATPIAVDRKWHLNNPESSIQFLLKQIVQCHSQIPHSQTYCRTIQEQTKNGTEMFQQHNLFLFFSQKRHHLPIPRHFSCMKSTNNSCLFFLIYTCFHPERCEMPKKQSSRIQILPYCYRIGLRFCK